MTMTAKTGIDVSAHNGVIDWDAVKSQIDFAILRAGYGQKIVDIYFDRNATACTRLKIPFGMYWYSYAYNAEMAKCEADYICDLADEYKPQYPICFDYEYDSDEYAKKHGIEITKELRIEIAKAFLERVEARGYYAVIYSNPDYLNKGFSELISRYDLWLAHWKGTEPSQTCGMWQSGSTDTIAGISSKVDTDFAYKDYPTIIDNMRKEEEEKQKNEMEKLKDEKWELYCRLAREVWQGKWGNGFIRRAKLKAQGYDYDYVQAIVKLMK